MIRYVNTGVVFQEVPDEVTLSINISNCPCHCIGCHSKYLWEDIGEPLNYLAIDDMLRKYGDDITCVGLMGGDANPLEVNDMAAYIKSKNERLKVAWYSGRHEMAEGINLRNFDFIKLGPYIESRGGLDKRTTNQKFFRVEENLSLTDITNKFWKK